MLKTIKTRQKAREWQNKFDARAPRAGSPAPDFELRDTEGQNPVLLSDFQGQTPVALVFGSFT
jgi:peroxiredoxin